MKQKIAIYSFAVTVLLFTIAFAYGQSTESRKSPFLISQNFRSNETLQTALDQQRATVLPLYTGRFDEPLGREYSSGLSLWHLGHNSDMIQAFHDFLGSDIETLAPHRNRAPRNIKEIILDPENLDPSLLEGWTVIVGSHIQASGGDTIRPIYIPLTIGKESFYKVSFKYRGYDDQVAIFAARIFKDGEEMKGDFVDEIFNETPAGVDGYTWHSILVDLTPGTYQIRIEPRVTNVYYRPVSVANRELDAIFITEAVWEAPPSDTQLNTLRAAADLSTVSPIQRESLRFFTIADANMWRRWRVRPFGVHEYATSTDVFEKGSEFRDTLIEEIASRGYCGTGTHNLDCNGNGVVELQCDNFDASGGPSTTCDLPHYSDRSRLQYFDDVWNMVADPVRVSLQKDYLQNLIDSSSSANSYCINATDFSVPTPWELQGTTNIRSDLSASAGDSPATYTINSVEGGETYKAWINFRNLASYYATKELRVVCSGSTVLTKSYTSNLYTTSSGATPLSYWDNAGTFAVPAGATSCSYEIHPLSNILPKTYRIVYGGLVTSDLDFVPSDSQKCPAMSPETLVSKVESRGGFESLGYVAQVQDITRPVLQDWIPSADDPVVGTLSGSGFAHAPYDVSLMQNMKHSALIALRNMTNDPMTVSVRMVNPLLNAQWSVVAYMPYWSAIAPSLETNWSGLATLQRRNITLPPYGVAQMLVSFDTDRANQGVHTLNVFLTADGYKKQTLPFAVDVSSSDIDTAPEVLVGGYVRGSGRSGLMGEGYENLIEDAGINVLYQQPYTAISKAEMVDRGILLQVMSANITTLMSDIDDIIYFMTDRTSSGASKDCGSEACLDLAYDDWILKIGDEPSSSLTQYTNLAVTAESVDPLVRLLFNPGESATLATFSSLSPYADMWQPFVGHVKGSLGDQIAKYDIYSQKPWFFYHTPVYKDKENSAPETLYQHIAHAHEFTTGSGLPSLTNFKGSDAFSLYHVFRNPWDTGYEYLVDEGVAIFPGLYRAQTSVSLEAVKVASQHARIVEMVRNDSNFSSSNPAHLDLIESGTTSDLIRFIESEKTAEFISFPDL